MNLRAGIGGQGKTVILELEGLSKEGRWNCLSNSGDSEVTIGQSECRMELQWWKGKYKGLPGNGEWHILIPEVEGTGKSSKAS